MRRRSACKAHSQERFLRAYRRHHLEVRRLERTHRLVLLTCSGAEQGCIAPSENALWAEDSSVFEGALFVPLKHRLPCLRNNKSTIH